MFLMAKTACSGPLARTSMLLAGSTKSNLMAPLVCMTWQQRGFAAKKKGSVKTHDIAPPSSTHDISDDGEALEVTPSKQPKKRQTKEKKPRKPMEPTELTAALSSITGLKLATRGEVLKKVWEYINEKQLKDEKVKTQINLDDKMKALIVTKEQNPAFAGRLEVGTKAIKITQVLTLVSPHIKTKNNDLSWYSK